MTDVPRWALRLVAVLVPKVRSNLAADEGDLCRVRRDWVGAAQHYRRAVRISPNRRSIWVQLGHALKEAGCPDDALHAYRRASALAGADGDAPAHLGSQALLTGHFVEAKDAFLQATRENPGNLGARAQFVEMLHEPRAVGDAATASARALAADEAARLAGMKHAEDGAQVVFDASDLVSYFRHSRLPTGIQRVQIEVIRAALSSQSFTQVGCFSDVAGTWLRIPAAHFIRLCDLAVSGGDLLDPNWIQALEVLAAVVGSPTPVTFTQGGFLVNLGTSWWLQNYFLHVRAAQRSHGIHYVPFVHDFIPVVAPEHCVPELTQDFLSWAQNVFDHADFFLVNSLCTQADLHKVARILGHTIAPAHVRVVPLDADFRRPGLTGASPDQLAEWGLEPGGYVLFVSTIESRKNHVLAFQAWQDLIARHGAALVPDLVCVGNRGWLNDHVYAALSADPALSAKVRMLSHLSDEQLALLYGECRFTLYPSSYEGWGLPVTESLCFGKVPLLSRHASLPEAGGDFAVYTDPGDKPGFVAALEHLMFDSADRVRRETDIRARFRPRSWSQVASQIGDDLAAFIQIAGHEHRRVANPAISLDRVYRLTRNRRTRLARDAGEGEQFRSGSGWWGPEDWGCSTRRDGGSIAISVPAAMDVVRCWVRLRGPMGHGSEVTITCDDRALRCDLPGGAWRWVSFLVRAREGDATFHINGQRSEIFVDETQRHARREIGVGIGGLIACSYDEARSPVAVATALAGGERGPVGFLRDIFPLLLNREIDLAEVEDFLLPAGSGCHKSGRDGRFADRDCGLRQDFRVGSRVRLITFTWRSGFQFIAAGQALPAPRDCCT